MYTEEPTDPDIQEEFAKLSKKLTDTDKQELDREITSADIAIAKQQLSKNKSPGPGGLTAKFYQHFIPILAPLLVQYYTNCFLL
jgi:hypothetical protein